MTTRRARSCSPSPDAVVEAAQRVDDRLVVTQDRRCRPWSTILFELRARTYRAYRTALGVDDTELPADFGDVVDVATTFAEPLPQPSSNLARNAAERRWLPPT